MFSLFGFFFAAVLAFGVGVVAKTLLKFMFGFTPISVCNRSATVRSRADKEHSFEDPPLVARKFLFSVDNFFGFCLVVNPYPLPIFSFPLWWSKNVYLVRKAVPLLLNLLRVLSKRQRSRAIWGFFCRKWTNHSYCLLFVIFNFLGNKLSFNTYIFT